MKNQITIWMLVLGIMVFMTVSVSAQDWALKGDHTEACCCDAACPCNFGSTATMGHCDGNILLEIREGHFRDVRLDGISVIMAFRLGDWVKLYISDNATDEQAKAAEQIMKLEPTYGILFSYGEPKILPSEKAPVSIEKTSTKMKFSVPASTVEIEMLEGRDGKPIKIENLSFPWLDDYIQYKTITTSHKSENKEFSYSGTHAARSKIEVSGKIATKK